MFHFGMLCVLMRNSGVSRVFLPIPLYPFLTALISKRYFLACQLSMLSAIFFLLSTSRQSDRSRCSLRADSPTSHRGRGRGGGVQGYNNQSQQVKHILFM